MQHRVVLEDSYTFKQRLISSLSLVGAMIISHCFPTAHYQILPDLLICVVYFWCVMRPSNNFIITIFFVGIFEDVFLGNSIGITPLIWLSAYFFAMTQRKFMVDKSFMIVWSGFSLTAALSVIIKVLLLGNGPDFTIPYQSVFLSYLATIFIYPGVAYILLKFMKAGQ